MALAETHRERERDRDRDSTQTCFLFEGNVLPINCELIIN